MLYTALQYHAYLPYLRGQIIAVSRHNYGVCILLNAFPLYRKVDRLIMYIPA